MLADPSPKISERGGWVQDLNAQSYSRKMYGGEAAFAMIATHPSSRGHGSLAMQVTYTTTTPTTSEAFITQLRNAWLSIRYDLHPLVACTARHTGNILDPNSFRLTYPVVNSFQASIWANDTVVLHPASTRDELVHRLEAIAPIADGSGRSRATLHVAPASTESEGAYHMVFVAGHWMTDGRGSLKLFDHILRCLNAEDGGILKGGERKREKMSWGDEVERLSPYLAVAMGVREIVGGELNSLFEEEVKGFLGFVGGVLADAEPVFEPSLAPPREVKSPLNHSTTIALTPVQSTLLLSLTRAHKTTITSLLNLLIMINFCQPEYSIQSESSQRAKTVQLPLFSVHRGESLQDEWKSGLGLQMVLAPVILPAEMVYECCDDLAQGGSKKIWEVAAVMGEILKTNKSMDISVKLDHEVVSAVVPPFFAHPSDGADFHQRNVPFVTSVGRIGDYLCNSPRDAQWIAYDPVNHFTTRWARTTCHIWEWEGRIEIKVMKGSEWFAEVEVAEFAERLRAGLGLVMGERL